MASQHSDLDLVESLLGDYLALPERERPAALERLLARHIDHASEIQARLAALRAVGLGVAPSNAAFPERLGEFRLLRRLGGGGMGVVYLAEQQSLRRQVALKLIRPEHLYFPRARERFRREVEVVARLQHPGIVPVYSVGEEVGMPYFAMEYVPGATLAAVLQELAGRDPAALSAADLAIAVAKAAGEPSSTSGDELFRGTWVQCCVRLILRVTEALQHAHERGVLHRDLKPSNIMLTVAGRVMLFDFGLASTE